MSDRKFFCRKMGESLSTERQKNIPRKKEGIIDREDEDE